MGVRDRIAKAVMGIKAYHSSPHDFDRFDLSKIGTGEGAQVYGHGIYAAENPAVSGQGGQYWQQFTGRFQGAERSAADRLHKFGFDRDAATADAYKAFDAMKARYDALPQAIKDNPRAHGLPTRSFLEERQQEIDLLRGGAPVGPRTYELNIKADPAQMLDWDRALSQQPHVEDVLRRGGFVDAKWPYSGMQGAQSGTSLQPLTSGEDVYRAMGIEKRGRSAPQYDQRKAATDVLGEAGIPGIKYLDQGSRAGGIPSAIEQIDNGWRVSLKDPQGITVRHRFDDEAAARAFAQQQANPTSNYVIFDPSIIDITKKYAIPGAIAAPVMGAIGDQSQYEEAQ